jgi:hypothetical protein
MRIALCGFNLKVVMSMSDKIRLGRGGGVGLVYV